MAYRISIAFAFAFFFGCGSPTNQVENTQTSATEPIPFMWENATIYFLLTDRFHNGNPNNDINYDRVQETGTLRQFMGGDMQGITKKINSGYFDKLGVDAIWFTPVVEQIHGSVNEGTGNTYGYHGYWAKDWTALDPNFGTEEDLANLVEAAHKHGIRILLDVVINHTGPVTENDPFWGSAWAKEGPQCKYTDYESTVTCTLVKNLPDINTESNEEVGLPQFLKDKWEKEGRLEKEMAELDAFFERTGHPRAPRFYIIKWLTDMIRKYGVDGFRMDTMKHIEESVWGELIDEAKVAFADWKKANPDKVLDDQDFFAVGEVYGYGVSGGLDYDYGDQKVNYFAEGVNSLINFEFKYDATQSYEEIFTKYDELLNTQLKGYSTLNYATSHDDGSPFDVKREKPLETATKLLLCPGQAQIYYGDESARPLEILDAEGDANLRSYMNWDEAYSNYERSGFGVKDVLSHWQKLGQFRQAHPSIGAGRHKMITSSPYVFERVYEKGEHLDAVIIGLDLPKGEKTINVGNTFDNGATVKDFYSGETAVIEGGEVKINSEYDIVLLSL